MLLSKEHLEVVKAASTDATQPALQNLHVTSEYVEATDGQNAIRKYINHEFPNDGDFPKIDGVGYTTEPLEECLLPKASVNKLIKAMGRNNSTLPILSNVLLSEAGSNKNRHAVFAMTDLDVHQIIKIRKFEGEYPNVNGVFPEGRPVQVAVDPASVIHALQQFKGPVVINIHGKNTPIVIRSVGPQIKTEALVMPSLISDKDSYESIWGAIPEPEPETSTEPQG